MIEVRLPQEMDDIDESLVVLWFVSVGDAVKQGDPLCEIQTEKAVSQIEAESSGTVKEILVKRGESAKVGEVLATINPGGASSNAEPAEQKRVSETETKEAGSKAQQPSAYGRVTPRLRKLAKELGVRLDTVTGTGKNGAITEADVRKAGGTEEGPSENIPLSGIRGTIAKRMKESLQNSAQLTETAWADVTELSSKKRQGVGWTALVAKAAATALRANPRLNAHITDSQIIPRKEINLGFAVDTEQGLQVAVIRDSDKQSPDQLHEKLTELAETARSGKLSSGESSGGTFTITSLGTTRVQFFTPIINPPEVAILGIGNIEPYVVLRDGKLSERLRLPLSLTFDHRAIDGAPAALFLTALIGLLEKPEWVPGDGKDV